MNHYDVTCPFCGTINKSLFLDETDGRMECERCKRLVRVEYKKGKTIMAAGKKSRMNVCLA